MQSSIFGAKLYLTPADIYIHIYIYTYLIDCDFFKFQRFFLLGEKCLLFTFITTTFFDNIKNDL